ncbi:hypothetical protein FHG87_024524 [Trinorchestia longiramus]|nr:hypothetical protein FHG87_024524 [Trinorchestia longiramus]
MKTGPTDPKTDSESVNDVDVRRSRDFTKRQDNRRLDGSPHYPSKINYGLSEVVKDLLNFAASNLTVGGRLVFWMPIIRDEYTSSGLPSHPCLMLAHNSEQILNSHSSRRLLTYVKTRAALAHEVAEAEVADFSTHFREKFFIAAQMTREERVARKCLYSRDKRGQGLGYRVTNHLENTEENSAHQISLELDAPSDDSIATKELNGRSELGLDICKFECLNVDESLADAATGLKDVATGSAE